MSDEKTTAFPDAATLDGTELVGVVQGGTNVQTTAYYVSNFVNNRSFVQMGKYANGGGEQGVAVGYYAQAFGPNAIAVGSGAYSDALGAISVGYHATTNNFGSIAIGTHCYNHGNYAIAVGGRATTNGDYAIAVGAYASAESSCIAIGYHAKGYNSNSIAIGAYSKGYGEKSIAIGFRAKSQNYGSIAVGYNSYAHYKSVAIGARSRSFYNYCISIGIASECLAAYGIAIGPYAYTIGVHAITIGAYSNSLTNKAVALGYRTSARAAYSVAIGTSANSEGQASFALGHFATAAQDHSMVLGASSTDVCMGSLVIGGVPVDFALRPCDHYQKFVGQTVPAVSAVAAMDAIGVDDAFAIISYTPGAAGNSFFLATSNPGISNTLSVSFDSPTLTILLGTDGDGNLDPSQNTLGNIASQFPTNGFTFAIEGASDNVVVAIIDVQLADGEDNTPTVILTADGNSPTGSNTPAMWAGAIATLTGRVTGAGSNIFSSSDDAACFILTPLLVYRDDEGTYNFIGTPTFTMENNTEGAADWPVPTLSLDGDTGFLDITVVNTVETLNWMAHFKFETSA